MPKPVPLRPHRAVTIPQAIPQPSSPVPNSTGAVREFLLRQMVAVAEGKLDHQTATSICKLAQQSYNFSKLELRASEIASRHGNVTIDSWAFQNEPTSHEPDADTGEAQTRRPRSR
jgi:hypothetical protein